MGRMDSRRRFTAVIGRHLGNQAQAIKGCQEGLGPRRNIGRRGQPARTHELLGGVQGLVGQHMGYSDWVTITQEQVNQFAEATGDHQWIHVDPERAAKESPFGGPIAHGYLTLSLVPALLPEIVERPDHPWFIGVQFHPELKSKPFDPHPLFAGFIEAALQQARLV